MSRSTTAARAAIDGTPARRIGVSTISLWEIGLGLRRGRLHLGLSLTDWTRCLRDDLGLHLVPVTEPVVLREQALDWPHADPADRLIVATADHLDVPLVTSDRRIRSYRPTAIW